MKRIEGLAGEYRFLSNFWPSPLDYQGLHYPTAEHAYQAAKCLDQEARSMIANLETPGKAKRSHAKMQLPGELVGDWKTGPAQLAMAEITAAKYRSNPDLARQLLDTGEAIITETNDWHDNFWGDCTCQECVEITGQNTLGVTLMSVRAMLRSSRHTI